MKKFLRKNKKYIGLILIAAMAFNFLFLPLTALAQPTTAKDDSAKADTGGLVSWFKGSAVLFISSTISALLGALFGIVLWLEAQIIDYIISPANFSFINSPIVTLGWGITRDLANMFFILILLAIAFATVLKIQSYAIKQLWWKVLAAAILINFSLVIAGFVIDFTQILTTFFLNQITGNGNLGTVMTRLASSMQILNFYNPQNGGILGGLTQFGTDSMAAAIGVILTLVGLVVTVFVFGALAIFLIVRILYIWFLLIIAPIVWILWIIPATSRYFSQWWDNFIKWAFFAPAYVFMIYLSLSIFDANGKFNTGVFPQGNSAWGKAAPGLTTVAMPAAIFQWILVIAMMFGSLIVAQKLGAEGATGARKILTGWGTDTKNWAGRYARRKTTGWAQPLTEAEKATPPPQGFRGRIGAAWRKTGAALGGTAAKVPGVRGAYLGMGATTQKDYDEAYNKYKNVDPAVLEQIAKSPILPEARYQLALQQILMEKKKFKPNAKQLMPILDQAKRYNKEEDFLKIVADKMGDELTVENGYTAEQREELARRAKSSGVEVEKGFYKTLPVEMAKVLGKSVEEIVGKIKTSETSKINKLALENNEVRAAMAKKFIGEHVMSAAKEDRTDIIDALEKGIKETGIEQFKTNNPRLAKWIQKSPGSTFFKETIIEETKEKTEEVPGITVVGKYAKIPPAEERKG